MATQIQLRRGTTAEWAATNPVLAQGEVGIDLTLGEIRLGDGVTAWVALAVIGAVDPADINSAIADYLDANPVPAPDLSGYALADHDHDGDYDPAGTAAGLVAVQQVALTAPLAYTLPAGTPADVVHSVVFTQDGTGGHTVTYGGQPVAVDTTAGASTLVEIWPNGEAVVIGAPVAAGSVAWADVTGKPATFAPTAHKASHATGGTDVLTPADIGAQPAGSYVPTTRTVNGKALSANITLTAADVGASTFSGAYSDLSDKPTLGTAAATAATDYATAAQGTKADSALQVATPQPVNAQTSAYTLVASDAGKLVTMTLSTAADLIVPASVFTVPAGTVVRVDVLDLGTARVTFVAGSGLTLTGAPSLVSSAQYAGFSVIFTSATTATVVGALAAA